MTSKKYVIPAKTTIGHIHLTVSDIKRSLVFYQDILGFTVTQNVGEAVFLAAGDYHHTLGLNTWSTRSSQTPQEGQIGLYHFALLYPTRKDLAQVLKQLMQANYPLEGAADHGVSQSIYLKDPDGNGIELYTDKDKNEWPLDKQGKLTMHTKSLDIQSLLKEA